MYVQKGNTYTSQGEYSYISKGGLDDLYIFVSGTLRTLGWTGRREPSLSWRLGTTSDRETRQTFDDSGNFEKKNDKSVRPPERLLTVHILSVSLVPMYVLRT